MESFLIKARAFASKSSCSEATLRVGSLPKGRLVLLVTIEFNFSIGELCKRESIVTLFSLDQ